LGEFGIEFDRGKLLAGFSEFMVNVRKDQQTNQRGIWHKLKQSSKNSSAAIINTSFILKFE
jgi:hypothetical protein